MVAVDCSTFASITLCPTFWAATGAGLSVLLSAIGAGIGIGISGPAIAGAGVERPEVMLKTFIATILAEALAIYGLVVGLLSVFHITDALTLAGSVRIFAGGLTMGAAALGAGFGIGTSGSALAAATAEKPEIFSRAVITLILAEALAIYALVTALLLVLQASLQRPIVGTETLSHIVRDNYIVAKIRGEKGKLLERQQLHSLAEFRTQSEILGVLADGPYGKELSELRDGSSPIETERAVRLGFARGVRTLISASQGLARDFLLEFSRRFDAYDLAAIVVFKAQGKTWEEFVSTRQPLALLKEAELHRLYSMDDLRTIVGIVGDRALVNRVKGFSMEDLVGERASLVRDIITGWGEERFYNYLNDKLGGFDRGSCLPMVGGAVDLANLIIILRR